MCVHITYMYVYNRACSSMTMAQLLLSNSLANDYVHRCMKNGRLLELA